MMDLSERIAEIEQVSNLRSLDVTAGKGSFIALTQAEWKAIKDLLQEVSGLRAVLKLAGDFIEDEADSRGAAGSTMSDYEREPRELLERIDAALKA